MHRGRRSGDHSSVDVYGALRSKWWQLEKSEVKDMLCSMRNRTFEIVQGVSYDDRLLPSRTPLQTPSHAAYGLNLNPPAWTLGHVTFFYLVNAIPMLASVCCEDEAYGEALETLARHFSVDDGPRSNSLSIFDSARVNGAERWQEISYSALRDREKLLNFMKLTHDRVLELVDKGASTDDGRLDPIISFTLMYSIVHEGWHQEDLIYTRKALGYSLPKAITTKAEITPIATGDDAFVTIRGGTYMLGCARTEPFVLDCEKWAHEVDVKTFTISKYAATNAQFCKFLAAGGYDCKTYWSHEGWRWRCSSERRAPRYWKKI